MMSVGVSMLTVRVDGPSFGEVGCWRPFVTERVRSGCVG